MLSKYLINKIIYYFTKVFDSNHYTGDNSMNKTIIDLCLVCKQWNDIIQKNFRYPKEIIKNLNSLNRFKNVKNFENYKFLLDCTNSEWIKLHQEYSDRLRDSVYSLNLNFNFPTPPQYIDSYTKPMNSLKSIELTSEFTLENLKYFSKILTIENNHNIWKSVKNLVFKISEYNFLIDFTKSLYELLLSEFTLENLKYFSKILLTTENNHNILKSVKKLVFKISKYNFQIDFTKSLYELLLSECNELGTLKILFERYHPSPIENISIFGNIKSLKTLGLKNVKIFFHDLLNLIKELPDLEKLDLSVDFLDDLNHNINELIRQDCIMNSKSLKVLNINIMQSVNVKSSSLSTLLNTNNSLENLTIGTGIDYDFQENISNKTLKRLNSIADISQFLQLWENESSNLSELTLDLNSYRGFNKMLKLNHLNCKSVTYHPGNFNDVIQNDLKYLLQQDFPNLEIFVIGKSIGQMLNMIYKDIFLNLQIAFKNITQLHVHTRCSIYLIVFIINEMKSLKSLLFANVSKEINIKMISNALIENNNLLSISITCNDEYQIAREPLELYFKNMTNLINSNRSLREINIESPQMDQATDVNQEEVNNFELAIKNNNHQLVSFMTYQISIPHKIREILQKYFIKFKKVDYRVLRNIHIAI